MKRVVFIIGICACAMIAYADSTVSIPLIFGVDGTTVCAQPDSGDDPGSSTVDPVDPNQAKAELTGNTLKVYEGLEGNVQLFVYNKTHPQSVLYTSFDQSVTLQLTDTALYSIQLYHPELGHVYGTFYYPINHARKVMQGGRVFICTGNMFYTPSGMKIH